MEDGRKKFSIPLAYWIFGTLAVISFVGVSIIPSTMIYRLRLFSAIGLPEGFAEGLRFVIIAALPFAVLTTGCIRVFAVSDSRHADALTWAAVLEIVSWLAEIVASLVNGADALAIAAQGVFMCISLGAVGIALILSISTSGYYKLNISHNEIQLGFDAKYAQMHKDMLSDPDVQRAMKAALIEEVKMRSEANAGKPLFQPGALGVVPINRNGTDDEVDTRPSP